MTKYFLAARVHVKEGESYRRLSSAYGAPWTPTTLLLDSDGVERHRIEGFLPLEDFLAQLTLGLGHLAFHSASWDEAGRFFKEVIQKFPSTDAAPEAQYWAGVSRYKTSGDAAALQETATAFESKYRDSSWAKKASVWKAASATPQPSR